MRHLLDGVRVPRPVVGSTAAGLRHDTRGGRRAANVWRRALRAGGGALAALSGLQPTVVFDGSEPPGRQCVLRWLTNIQML